MGRSNNCDDQFGGLRYVNGVGGRPPPVEASIEAEGRDRREEAMDSPPTVELCCVCRDRFDLPCQANCYHRFCGIVDISKCENPI
ncbi:hypothetical protein C4D60_Mb01t09400 [Musa balbisiana]|uniref:Uncharacterized protein n=1 Tax=Musa balbisiana TaxID=52838 RepID=A0A4S8JL92_MUSBA|nr:hypothetical protein C4D60_Mb01t09400 [Musa balbisiana]